MARTNKYTSLNFNDIYEKKIINNNNNNNNSNSNSKSTSSLSSANKSYSLSASSRIHGNMLVLSRPSPKPQPQQQQHPLSQSQSPIQHQTQPIRQIQESQLQSQVKQHHPISNSITPSSQSQPSILSSPPSKSSESISLRPKGNTGGSASFQEREIKADVVGGSNNNNSNHHHSNMNSNKFVPPHLRPGYVPKEVTAVPEFQKRIHRPVSAHGIFHGSPNRFVDDNRPKSGGGYDRRMRGPGFGPGHGPGYGPAESDLVRPRSGGSRPSSSG